MSLAISYPWRARSSRRERTSISALPFLRAASGFGGVVPICMTHTYHRRPDVDLVDAGRLDQGPGTGDQGLRDQGLIESPYALIRVRLPGLRTPVRGLCHCDPGSRVSGLRGER